MVERRFKCAWFTGASESTKGYILVGWLVYNRRKIVYGMERLITGSQLIIYGRAKIIYGAAC